jgi:hypothetical protein
VFSTRVLPIVQAEIGQERPLRSFCIAGTRYKQSKTAKCRRCLALGLIHHHYYALLEAPQLLHHGVYAIDVGLDVASIVFATWEFRSIHSALQLCGYFCKLGRFGKTGPDMGHRQGRSHACQPTAVLASGIGLA